MADTGEVLINAGVFGVALPAVLAGAAGLSGRISGRAAAALSGVGVAAGYLVAHLRLAGAPAWPPVDATHWLPVATTAGAILAAGLGGVGFGDRARERRSQLVGAGLFLALAVWLVRGLLGSWLERWTTGQAYQEVALLAALGTAAYVGIGRLVSAEERGRSFGALVAVGILVGGAAATLGLARSVLLAQLLGAVGAGVGGLALASLARVPGSVLSFAAAPIALALTAAVGAGQHYAELPRAAAVALLLAPALAAVAIALPKQLWIQIGLAVGVSGGAVAGASFLTARATGDADAYVPPSGEVKVELDYGYGGAAEATEAPAGTDAAEPDPYGDMRAMKDWKPGQ